MVSNLSGPSIHFSCPLLSLSLQNLFQKFCTYLSLPSYNSFLHPQMTLTSFFTNTLAIRQRRLKFLANKFTSLLTFPCCFSSQVSLCLSTAIFSLFSGLHSLLLLKDLTWLLLPLLQLQYFFLCWLVAVNTYTHSNPTKVQYAARTQESLF